MRKENTKVDITTRRISKNEIEKMLDNHKKWLEKNEENFVSIKLRQDDPKSFKNFSELRADFSYADLSGVDLSNAQLYGAIFCNTNLRGAILDRADLRRCNFTRADLTEVSLQKALASHSVFTGSTLIKAKMAGAQMFGSIFRESNMSKANLHKAIAEAANFYYATLDEADLSYAELNRANLMYAYICEANLTWASLMRANLYGANLRGSNLRTTDLCRANLSEADLTNADLLNAYTNGASFYGADLNETKNIPFIPLACPSDGAFIGWKKVKKCLVKLEIPEDAKRSSATTHKCRCDKAKVLGIYTLNGNLMDLKQITNSNFCKTVYKVGEMVYPDKFDTHRFNECSNGIHFFINKEDAITY